MAMDWLKRNVKLRVTIRVSTVLAHGFIGTSNEK